MFFYATPRLPKLQKLIANKSYVRIQNGNIFKVGQVTPVTVRDLTYYLVELLDPKTKDLFITVGFYSDGGVLHGRAHMLGISIDLRIVQIIEMDDFTETLNLKVGDVAVLRNGTVQEIEFIEPYKWSPERLEIYSEDQDNPIMLYAPDGVCVGTLRKEKVKDDIYSFDLVGVNPTKSTITELKCSCI